MRRWTRISLVTVILSLMLLLLASSIFAVRESDLEVDITLGYEETGRIGDGNPLDMEIINKGESFTGELQLFVERTDGHITIYAKTFDIAAGATKNISMTFPMLTIQREFDVKIVSGNKELYEDTIKLQAVYPPESASVGVLTTQADRYRFLAGLEYLNVHNNGYYDYYPISYYGPTITEEETIESYEPRAIFLESYESLITVDRLNFFDYLYIGYMDDFTLTQEQVQVLNDWVKLGGTLVFESGNNYEKIASMIPDALSIVEYQGTSTANLNDYDMNYPLNQDITIALASPKTDDVETIRVNEEILGFYKTQGQGAIVQLSMDFRTDPLYGWNGKKFLFQDMMSQVTQQAVEMDYYYEDDYMYQNFLNFIPAKNTKPYTIMMIVLGLYILATGPLLYLFMKKKDKRKHMWWMIPSMAIGCLLVFYLVGFTTRYTKPIVNNISKISFADGDRVASVETHMSILNNRKGDMVVSWDRSQTVEFEPTLDYYYYGYYEEDFKPEVKAKVNEGSKTNYTLFDAPVWEGNYLSAKKSIDMDLSQMLEVRIEENEVVVVVKNDMPLALEYAFVQWGNHFINVGTVTPGQTVEVRENINSCYFDSYYAFDENRFGYMQYGNVNAEDIGNLEKDYRLRELLNSNYSYGYYPRMVQDQKEVKLIGINKDSVNYDIEVNGSDYESFNTNIIEIVSSITYEVGSQVLFDSDLLLPNARFSYYDDFSNATYVDYNDYEDIYYLYDLGIMEISYKLPADLDVTSFYLEYPIIESEEAYYNKQNNNNEDVTGYIVSVYNYETGEYEPFSEDISLRDGQGSAAYLGDDSRVIVRLDFREANVKSQQGWFGIIISNSDIEIEGVVIDASGR